MMGKIWLDRKILEWEWWSDINTYRLFTYCLLKANWKDGNFLGVKIPRGSFATSYGNLSAETSLSVRQLRTAFSHLKSTGEVTIIRHSKFSVVVVNNYNQYQSLDNQNDSQMAEERQRSDREATTIEKGNKGKKKKEYIGAFKISENETLQSAFNDFIEMRKAIKKPMTERAVTNLVSKLNKLSKDEYTQADILDQSINHCWQDVYPLKNEFVSTRVRPLGTTESKANSDEPEMTDEEWAAMYEPGGKMYVESGGGINEIHSV